MGTSLIVKFLAWRRKRLGVSGSLGALIQGIDKRWNNTTLSLSAETWFLASSGCGFGQRERELEAVRRHRWNEAPRMFSSILSTNRSTNPHGTHPASKIKGKISHVCRRRDVKGGFGDVDCSKSPFLRTWCCEYLRGFVLYRPTYSSGTTHKNTKKNQVNRKRVHCGDGMKGADSSTHHDAEEMQMIISGQIASVMVLAALFTLESSH